jgi:iron complex outermembrane receptor protein
VAKLSAEITGPRCLSALTTLLAGLAGADQTPETAPQTNQSLPRVVITGSTIPRVDAETALPVQIIRREEIERSGALSVEELMGRIAANFGSLTQATGVGDPVHAGFSGASLRGFGSTQTLVLLNGRRVSNHAFSGSDGIGVDLNTIPLAAIERIEVLKDGASAIYGSDAVAGVVNFILRRDFRGAQVGVERGAAQAGGAAASREQLSLGAGDIGTDGFNVFAVIDHQQQKALAARDRPFAATAYRLDLGMDRTSASSFPANIPIGGGQFVNPAAPQCTALSVFQRGGCFYDFARQIDILPPAENLGLLSRATWALSNDTEIRAEWLWSRQRTTYVTSPTPVNRFGLSSTGEPLVVPVGSPFYPTQLGLTGDIVDPSYRTVALGLRTTLIDSSQWRALLGVRTQAAGWELDGALMQSTSRASSDFVNGYVDGARFIDAFATGKINLFGDSGPEGNALLASTESVGRARYSKGTTRMIDLRANRDIAQWSNGTVTLGLGGEARNESLDDRANALAATVVGGSALLPQAGRREAQALYAELALPLAPKLDAQFALRHDHYSDFGNHTSPKLALRWQPAKPLLLRASAGTGYRAPSLPELYGAQMSIVLPFFVPDPKRCEVTQLESDCAPEVPLVFGGNPALRPERSRQASLGLVFEPIAGASMAIDWWRLALRDKIASLSDERILDGSDVYEGKNIIRGPVDPAFPNLPGPIVRVIEINENVGRQVASGVDIDLQFKAPPTELGKFTVQLNGSYIDQWRIAFDGVHDERVAAGSVPRWQHLLTLGWHRGSWNATLSQTWRAGYVDDSPGAAGEPHRVAPYRIWDAQVAFNGVPDLTVTLGVKNLLDSDPPLSNQRNSFQVGYDPGYADPRGRFGYARVNYRWK